jgi:acyl carrier protein
MPKNAATRQIITEYVLAEFLPGEDPSQLGENTALITSGILDSLATLRLISFIEQRFEVRIAAHEADESNFDSIDLIANLIDSKLVRPSS